MENALRRGDENRPPTPDFRKYPVEWYSSSLAPSLRELARPQGVTEGVSSDGCSMPTIYTPAHIGSETFDRLRSPKYTPSVSHSLDSSLREGAGNGLCHSSYRPETGTFAGDFHRPYATQKILGVTTQCTARNSDFLHFTIHRTTLPQSRFARQLPQRGSRETLPFIGVLAEIRGYGRFSSPLRNSEMGTLYHSPKYTPSVSHSLDSSLREGAGNGLCHSS